MEEINTANLIRNFLQGYNPSSIIDGLGGHGLAAVFDYGLAGPTILFRCELDALPIRENFSTMSYASKNPDVSHKCGHDGHMTILAGLAPILSKAAYGNGRVILLFQPAEETGEGAMTVLKDLKFQDIKPDYVFALHNLPGFALHEILFCEGIFTAAVTSMIIRLRGIATHAAEPEKGKNPALALAEIIKASQLLVREDPNAPDFGLITPVYCEMGQKAYGMSAGDAEIHFTLRAWSSRNLDQLTNQLLESISQVSQKARVEFEYEFLQSFASCENNPIAVKIIEEAARKNNFSSTLLKTPFKWGEDFGLFTQKYPGAIFGLGAGIDQLPLHHQDYDFPDEIIETGVRMFATIIDLTLKTSHFFNPESL
jgi:amidohydrolase